MEAIQVQPGPLARSVADVNLAMRVLSAASVQSDPQVPPLAWPDPHGVSLVGLRVAMWTDDGWFHCAPAVRRAVHLAADAVRDRGAVVEEFQPPAVAEAMQLYFSLLSADGGADARQLLGDSPRHAQIARLVRLGRLPNLLRPLIGGMLNLLQQRYLSQLVRAARHGSAAEYWEWTAARTRYVERFMQSLHEQRYDAFLCPPHALPALTHGSFIHLPAAASYCMLPNLLGVPAGVVPVTRVGAYEQSDRRASHDRVERAALAVEAGSSGLPVGVQVGAPHWREDTVLAVMGAIEAQFPRSGC
jgi:fatty acid amide hydrolase